MWWGGAWGLGVGGMEREEKDEGAEVYGKSMKLDVCIFELVLFECE